MAARGLLLALTGAEAAELRARATRGPSLFARLSGKPADRDAAVLEFIEKIEERWDENWLCETDKAWEAIHRSLSGGSLEFDLPAPLHGVILGGQSIHEGGEFLISFKTAEQVKEISAAVSGLTDDEIGRRYDDLSDDDYEYGKSAEDREYTIGRFSQVREFYAKAGTGNRAVVFTVDQ